MKSEEMPVQQQKSENKIDNDGFAVPSLPTSSIQPVSKKVKSI